MNSIVLLFVTFCHLLSQQNSMRGGAFSPNRGGATKAPNHYLAHNIHPGIYYRTARKGRCDITMIVLCAGG